MAPAPATAMDALEIGEFLESQQTGVLAMADRGYVYAVPVAYTYDADGSDFYFNLGSGPHSETRSFGEAGAEASFAVYDRTEAGWKSVVAEGYLEPLSQRTPDPSIVRAVTGLETPFSRLHRRAAGEAELAIVRLATNKLSGAARGRLATPAE